MAIKIGLDAGHGLNTAGKQTPDKIKEWTLNDKVADKVQDYLKDYDVEIVRTDENEGITDEGLTYRKNKYISSGVKAFVSIHHNAFTGDWNNATGVEVYTDKNPTKQDEKLASCIYDRLVKYTGLKGRGIKQANWTVIDQDTIPAVLVEGGFMDGTNDYKVITSEEGQNAYAKAVAEGLIEFLELKKRVEPVYYRVQVGAFRIKLYANSYLKKVQKAGFSDAYVKYVNGYYKIQIGAYTVKANANRMLDKVKAKGFSAFITTEN